ncbi:MAG: 7-cyano-7-deazaguanine synthase QueC [Defluviitaleaceae bacterium]|nr:7-cyano-7-deazaguanine synthase QueC [Defluviitaleaceae bacterium]
MKNSKALVLFSGGQDSTTCLFWAIKNFEKVETITFDYGQRHKTEINCAANISKDLGVPNKILDMSLLNQIAPNALTRSELEIKSENGELPNTFVDGRNLLFISFSSILAKQKNINNIITGICETDYSGYPDCRDIFTKSLNVTLNLSMDYNFIIHTPLMWLDKADTWKLADELGAFDYVKEKTLTCYNGIIADGCGKCPACELRKNGLDRYLLKRKGENIDEFRK